MLSSTTGPNVKRAARGGREEAKERACDRFCHIHILRLTCMRFGTKYACFGNVIWGDRARSVQITFGRLEASLLRAHAICGPDAQAFGATFFGRSASRKGCAAVAREPIFSHTVGMSSNYPAFFCAGKLQTTQILGLAQDLVQRQVDKPRMHLFRTVGIPVRADATTTSNGIEGVSISQKTKTVNLLANH